MEHSEKVKKDEGFLKNICWRCHGLSIIILSVQIATTVLLVIIMIWMNSVMKSQINAVNSRQDTSNARIDTLHMIIIDMLKEKK
jgi:hypothetical protein